MIKVLIVDDERMIRELFTNYIEKAKDRYSLAGSINNARNVDIYCASSGVDLILMDICTANEESGIAAAQRIKAAYPKIKVIIVTSAPDYRFIEKAKQAGADSFWYKEVGDEELLDVMDRTMIGEHIFPDETPEVQIGNASSTEFTPKELEVLSYLLLGKGLHEIADCMNVEYSTIRTHVKNLKEKTGTKDIVGLCYIAAKSKLILPEY